MRRPVSLLSYIIPIRIYGRPSAIRAVSYLYQYLVKEVGRIADRAWNEQGRHTGASATSWKRSFRMGAAVTVYRRLLEEKDLQDGYRDAHGEDRALVLVRKDEEEVTKAYAEFSKRFTKTRSTTAGVGYQGGQAAGGGIALGGGRALGPAQIRLAG